jgi:large subunit ribosomal protein L35
MKNKLKTHKTAAKKIKVTGTKKYIERGCTQDHFNSRDRGRDKRGKRLDKNVSSTYKSHMKRLLPYQ